MDDDMYSKLPVLRCIVTHAAHAPKLEAAMSCIFRY